MKIFEKLKEVDVALVIWITTITVVSFIAGYVSALVERIQ
jgi:hypothetical protein